MKKTIRLGRGQAIIEYLLITVMVAVSCLAGVKIFSRVINKYYSNITVVYSVPIP